MEIDHEHLKVSYDEMFEINTSEETIDDNEVSEETYNAMMEIYWTMSETYRAMFEGNEEYNRTWLKWFCYMNPELPFFNEDEVVGFRPLKKRKLD